jgi:hypothetical protein
MGRIWREISGFVWWTYERGSLRYDIMVALILAFIFITPYWVNFRDKPPAPVEVMEQGVYRIDAVALEPSGDEVDTAIARVLRTHEGHEVHIQRHEPVRDAAGTLLAYKVWVDK